MDEFGLVKEQFNNLTGDIELNPASFGLFMRDIEEASLNLKTAIYSGNINLTADFYKQISKIAEKKYALISPDGTLSGNYYERYLTENGELADYTMDGKSPGLYMDHQRLGYWNGTDWKAFIANTGEMFLGSITETNYLHWDGDTLTIKGNLILPDGTAVEDMSADRSTLDGIPYFMNTNVAPSGSGLKLTSSYLGFYNGSTWKTYMDNTGGLYLSGSGSNSLAWNGSTLSITGNISASNISGGTVDGATVTSTYNDGSTYYNTTVVGGQLTQSYYNVSTSARRARLITQAGGIILQASTDSGVSYSDTVFISSVVGSSIRYGQISLRYNGTLSGTIEATSSGLSIIGSINNTGSITTDRIYTDSTSYMYDIMPYNTSSWLGSSLNPWPRIYTNDLVAPNATINIYGFKINTANYFSGAPGGSPIGRIQFQLSNGNVYVLPVYNP